jgi:hypothetical protein
MLSFQVSTKVTEQEATSPVADADDAVDADGVAELTIPIKGSEEWVRRVLEKAGVLGGEEVSSTRGGWNWEQGCDSDVCMSG